MKLFNIFYAGALAQYAMETTVVDVTTGVSALRPKLRVLSFHSLLF